MTTPFPKLSIITPSYNQASFLDQTIKSVLDQNYPDLDYIIMDGGSQDGSVEVIKRHQAKLSFWESVRDKGQVDAINKGLRRATGDWVGWQNSDDYYLPGAFQSFAKAAQQNPDADLIIADIVLVDEVGKEIRDLRYVRPTFDSVFSEGMVLANQAAFWRRSLHERIGYLNESYNCSFDYDWFLRVLAVGKAVHVREHWGCFRYHDAAKTSTLAARFAEENRMIRGNRDPNAMSVAYHRLRRTALTLAAGDLAYIARGLLRRLRPDNSPKS
jgi:glycosyltransferase involved in cell wall biosynthesis